MFTGSSNIQQASTSLYQQSAAQKQSQLQTSTMTKLPSMADMQYKEFTGDLPFS